jgi:hypothetical protein
MDSRVFALQKPEAEKWHGLRSYCPGAVFTAPWGAPTKPCTAWFCPRIARSPPPSEAKAAAMRPKKEDVENFRPFVRGCDEFP